MLRTLSLAAALAVAGTSQAAYVGGGLVSLDSWNTAASTAWGTQVTVFRMYAAFDGTSTTEDTVNSVFGANLTFAANLSQTPGPFGSNVAPNSGFFGFDQTLQWDSYVSIGLLTDTTTVGGDGDGINFGPASLTGGWFNSSPPNLIGQAQPDGTFGTGLNLVFLGQFTVMGDFGGLRADLVDIRSDGNFGNAGGVITQGTFNMGINSQDNPTAGGPEGIQFVPTPGAVALFGLAGLTAARRRRA